MSNLADTLLTATTDLGLVHRRVVRVGAVASWFAALLFIAIGLISGDESLILQSITPVITGGVMTLQILFDRENGSVALMAAAIVVMGFYSLIGNADTIVPAAVAMVIICALSIVFVERRVPLVVAAGAVGLLVAPQFWDLQSGEALVLGSVMSVSFVVTAVIFVSIRTATSELNARFQMLFEHSPTAVMEEDWSEAVAYVRSEYTGKPDRIKPFLLAYPAVVRRAIARARIVRVNRAAVELLEADDVDQLLGYRDPDKVTDETMEAFVEGLVTLYEQRRLFEYEVSAPTFKGRSIWMQTRAVDTSPDLSGKRIVMGLADISHIKQRNEAMAQLVKAKDEFVARVSHELRTPLTAVVGLTSELAASEVVADQEQRELLELVAGQAAEMSYIVEDLLVAARAEMGTVAIDTVIVDLGKELRGTLDGLGTQMAHIPQDAGQVYGDPSRIRQILRNLLTNAQRYGGDAIRVVSGEGEGRVYLEVRDDGEGVPEEKVSIIFDSYTTAHDGAHSQSVGLGLSVSRQLAEMMGGSLTYGRDRSETVFRLELPAAAMSQRALASNTASA